MRDDEFDLGELNAPDAIALVKGMTATRAELEALFDVEEAGKDRVTVKRALADALKALPAEEELAPEPDEADELEAPAPEVAAAPASAPAVSAPPPVPPAAAWAPKRAVFGASPAPYRPLPFGENVVVEHNGDLIEGLLLRVEPAVIVRVKDVNSTELLVPWSKVRL